ncbi:hypothetical protein EVAR_93474_1 [Eumeta japonica]|uniref:Uncharacterized protein n=1 Tax=Eumeta variegata TaxID=151549 RepID=A0A4C1TLX7_EUMVA|nr:hypothetical protein EVAR_93474_1 [Eumeta japonica]
MIWSVTFSDRVDGIVPTYGSELNNKYENKKTFTPTQRAIALHIGLTVEGRGRTVIYSDDLGVGLGPVLGNCGGHRILNIYMPGTSYSNILYKILFGNTTIIIMGENSFGVGRKDMIVSFFRLLALSH